MPEKLHVRLYNSVFLPPDGAVLDVVGPFAANVAAGIDEPTGAWAAGWQSQESRVGIDLVAGEIAATLIVGYGPADQPESSIAMPLSEDDRVALIESLGGIDKRTAEYDAIEDDERRELEADDAG